MKPISQKVFQEFFYNPPLKKYRSYRKAVNAIKIKEHGHFLAQLAHESCYLKYNIENYNYSKERLLQVFPKYFKNLSDKEIEKYVLSPKALDRAYANRLGNGDEESNDGSKYRGHGYISLTGKDQFIKYGVETYPSLALDEEINWMICARWWEENNIDDLCDDNHRDLSDQEIKKITLKVNGGYNGYADRVKKSEAMNRLLTCLKEEKYK